MSLLRWWHDGWKMWEPDTELDRASEQLEADLRAVQARAGDPEGRVPDWIRQMREQKQQLDREMVARCKRHRRREGRILWLLVVVTWVLAAFAR